MIRLEETFLRGSYPPLVTPFRGGAVDYDRFAQLVEHPIAQCVTGDVRNLGGEVANATLGVDHTGALGAGRAKSDKLHEGSSLGNSVRKAAVRYTLALPGHNLESQGRAIPHCRPAPCNRPAAS